MQRGSTIQERAGAPSAKNIPHQQWREIQKDKNDLTRQIAFLKAELELEKGNVAGLDFVLKEMQQNEKKLQVVLAHERVLQGTSADTIKLEMKLNEQLKKDLQAADYNAVRAFMKGAGFKPKHYKIASAWNKNGVDFKPLTALIEDEQAEHLSMAFEAAEQIAIDESLSPAEAAQRCIQMLANGQLRLLQINAQEAQKRADDDYSTPEI